MKKYENQRKSHCSVCGKRLSEKNTDGSIHWQIGNVDDTGIYCENCYSPKKGGKGRKKSSK